MVALDETEPIELNPPIESPDAVLASVAPARSLVMNSISRHSSSTTLLRYIREEEEEEEEEAKAFAFRFRQSERVFFFRDQYHFLRTTGLVRRPSSFNLFVQYSLS